MIIDNDAVVSMHYRLVNATGELIDTSQGDLPLVYMHNTNAILAALERELTGSAQGDTVDVVIYPEDGYGYADEELIHELAPERFSHITDLAVGMRVKAKADNGDTEMMSIIEIRDDAVVADLNHPLAGQVLHFTVAIVSVREPTAAERESGFADSTNPAS